MKELNIKRFRIGVDIGGTFTDGTLVDSSTGHVTTSKVLSTPTDPASGFISAVNKLLAVNNEVDPDEIEHVVHATTVATNAIIEGKTAKTAFITTEGFRDVLEIGYESRYDQYDVMIEKPIPLVPRRLRMPVKERVDQMGNVLQPLDEKMVDFWVPKLETEEIASVAIGYMHAYANPDHENRTRDRLAKRLPNLFYSLSSEVCPEIREYERFMTTVANAYVRPLIASYLSRLGYRLNGMGISGRQN